jgi:hypothetical protein
LPHNFNYIQFG